jgi:hypothetical protein
MKKKQWFFDMRGSLAAVGADAGEITRMVWPSLMHVL